VKIKIFLMVVIPFTLLAGIRNVQFSPTDTKAITIRTNSRIPTLIRFEDDIYRVYLGAPSSWIVKVVGKNLVIRPKENNPTGITVELASGQIIPFRTIITSRSSLADDIINVSLQGGVIVQEEVIRKRTEMEEKKEKAETPPAAKTFADDVASYNFSYNWKSHKRLKIKAVFDDGISTYIVYRKGSAAGAVYLKVGRHKEVVNFVIQRNVCRVDRTLREGEEFLVVYGKDKVKIKRKK